MSPVKRSASETTMDSCLADDEVTFLSTQQDSDSSTLFIQASHRQDNCMTECNNQNFTAEDSSDEKKATKINMKVPVEKIVEKIEGMTLYHNENLSESVVAMFENTNIQQSPNGTPLHSPLTKENVQQQQITGIMAYMYTYVWYLLIIVQLQLYSKHCTKIYLQLSYSLVSNSYSTPQIKLYVLFTGTIDRSTNWNQLSNHHFASNHGTSVIRLQNDYEM